MKVNITLAQMVSVCHWPAAAAAAAAATSRTTAGTRSLRDCFQYRMLFIQLVPQGIAYDYVKL
jgi:hypothetical protein